MRVTAKILEGGNEMSHFNLQQTDLNWYYSDWSRHYHPSGIRGNVNAIVESQILTYAGESMMGEIAQYLGITLPDNPMDAKVKLDEYVYNDMAKLRAIINELQKYYVDENTTAAWHFLRDAPKKFTTELPTKISNIYTYIKLSAFFYSIGMAGKRLQWEIFTE